MGVETEVREVEVRIVRCDWFTRDAFGGRLDACDAVTTEFLPDVTEQQGGPVLLNAHWLQLRTGGIKQWYFCSHTHLADWVAGPGAEVLDHGAQSLATKRTRSLT